MILVIDSSMKFLSVSLIYKENILASQEETIEHSHAKSITITINHLIQSANKTNQDIQAVAINQGPGSFTGLRVASSVAKGLCFALDIPLISIDGISAYSEYHYQKNIEKHDACIVMIDARRENYFYAITDSENNYSSKFAHITEIENIIHTYQNPLLINSNDLPDLKSEYLSKPVNQNWIEKKFEDLTLFEPNYIVNNYQTK